ncbi:MAG: 50S ribosomal protein L10, partial [Thermoplasmata archaeon]|nr:50S ribosomal protein L10 [Thermoplasmata archaeon]
GRTGLDSLIDHIDGQCAVVTTDLNPFKLFKQFEATKTPAPAKGGEIAPEDIVVKKGNTPFKPGPMVSEFQRAGLPAAIERGKIIIRKNTVLVKKGEEIPKRVAGVLTKLEIFPLVVGLDLRAAWEDGTVFDADSLRVDEEQMLSQFRLASLQALNLGVFAGYPTKQTIVPIIQKAFIQALSLSISSGYATSDNIRMLIAKARGQMMALASLLDPEALDSEIHDSLSLTPAAPPAPSVGEEKEEETSEPEKEEEVSEEDAAAGLGELFK